MSHASPDYDTADNLRALNADLGAQFLALFDEVEPDELHVAPATEEWSIDKNLGHIAEFPAYFARQLRQWLDGDRVVLGRVAEHSADRNDAVVRARNRSPEELRTRAEAAFAALARFLRMSVTNISSPPRTT